MRPVTLALLLAAMVAVGYAATQSGWGGGVALLLLFVVGLLIYRARAKRAASSEKFFGDPGEETRMTSIQGGSPSEMPVERDRPGAPPGPR
jgi:hypothetical protein